MKLAATLLTFAEGAWKDKWENQIRGRSPATAAACTAAMIEETAALPIVNGEWDCPTLGQDVATMVCSAKCLVGEKNWKKASIQVLFSFKSNVYN